MAPLFKWWGKQNNNHHHSGTPVVVKMSMLELEGSSDEDFNSSLRDNNNKRRGKNAKQLTWVLLLKAHKAAGCLASIAPALFTLVSSVKQRVSSGKTDVDVVVGGNGNGNGNESERETENLTVKTRLYHCIKLFLLLSVLLFCFEVIAYFNKSLHFGSTSLNFEVKGFFDWVYSKWVLIRVEYLAPPLQFLANMCILLFIVQSLDRLVLCLGCFWIRFKKIKPVYKLDDDDLENGKNGFFPMVLVQIPMCNEREVRHNVF
jgi:hypothetical protein